MPISWYDELLGYDWVRYAKLSSKASCVTAGVVGAIGIFLGYSWKYAFASILIGCILAIWEFPFIYYCIPQFSEFQSFVLEKFYMEREEGKAVLYFFLAILCLSHSSVNVLLGLVLLVSSITQVLAVMNKRADANDSARPINLNDSTSLLAASDPQPYMFGASRGASKGGSASNPSTPRQTTSGGSFMSGVLGGGNNNNSSDGASFGTFNSKEMFAEV